MKIKPSKSRSISVIKGKLSEQCLYISEEPIPSVTEKPVKSLERWYNTTLKDTDQVDQLRKNTINGLESINKSLLPERLKLWCLQFGLLQVSKLERLISLFTKKWLGLPRCFRSIGLYGTGILEFPVSSLEDEFKCGWK